jgi:outer membrane protein
MKKLLVSAALAASLMAPAAVQAQAVPPAAVAVVDLERVTTDCVACKVATSSLRGQVTSMQNREKVLSDSLGTEQKSIQASVDALAGKAPDAALEARAKAWQTRRDQAAQEVGRLQQQIQNNQRYVQQQIQTKLGPIYQAVMTRRGANVLLETGSTLAASATVDVTSDILAALNAGLPSISTTAPPAPAQPQGR